MEFFIETNERYHTGITIDEYNGVISLCAANRDKDGKVWKRWAFPQGKDRQPLDKAVPVSIRLGGQAGSNQELAIIIE